MTRRDVATATPLRPDITATDAAMRQRFVPPTVSFVALVQPRCLAAGPLSMQPHSKATPTQLSIAANPLSDHETTRFMDGHYIGNLHLADDHPIGRRDRVQSAKLHG